MISDEQRKRALDGLIEARGFIGAQLRGRGPLPESLRDLVHNIDRGIGALLLRTAVHDAGAYAHCSYCGRYSASPKSLSHHLVETCDCGQAHGWSGAFHPPGPDAQWSLGLEPT
jgi:hypothetical protein